MPKETWDQYNDTGKKRLNLTYRHSAVNFAYVIRSSDPADQVNATFIVYKNESASNGFNSTGHLFPGSTPFWTVSIPISSKQTQGQYTYHLFIATFDPEGTPGLFQLRINATGTITGGSNWTQPDGNPNVPWMFFKIPIGTSWPVSISDQLGRFSPFFFETPIPSTLFNATFVVEPPGNYTGVNTAQVWWNGTNGTTIAKFDVPVYYAGEGRWAAQSVIEANISTFPENYTTPYLVSVVLGSYRRTASFFVYPVYAAILPETWLTKQPLAVTENRTVEFAWIGSDLDGSVASYQFRMNSGMWAETVDTSITYAYLINGSHRFEVRSVDDDGLVDLTPAVRDFVVLINSPPNTQIVSAPNATALPDVFLAWQGSDVDGQVVSYDYSFDGGPWVNTLANNVTFLNVSSGNHTFRVRSVDNKGLQDPTPAEAVFTVFPSWCEKEVERLNALMKLLERRIEELEAEISNLTSLLDEATGENAALSAALESLEKEKEDLLSLVRHLGNEKTNLLSQIASLSSENEELEEALEICGNLTSDLQGKVQELNQALSELLAKNRELETGNEFLASLVEELREKIRELESQIPETPATSMFGTALLIALWGFMHRRKRR